MSPAPRRYFDHAASSPMNDACRAALEACDAQGWRGANPNSLHSSGRRAFEALEDARLRLARALGCRRPSEVVLTSGGTESNNLAVRGIALAVAERRPGRRRVLVSSLEHDSVLDAAESLVRGGTFRVERIPATRSGTVDLEALEGMLADDVALVSVMAANNETGRVQPVAEAAGLAHARGALFHTDAVQAFGHIPFDVARLGVDAASVAAHKLGGPVGVGALYLKARTPVVPQIVGGGQEGGLRSGTQDVRGACAFAAVADDALEHLPSRSAAIHSMARDLVGRLCRPESPVARETVALPREGNFVPGIVHLIVPGHQTEGLVLALDEGGFEVAGGSACSSGSLEPSHVLAAMGLARDDAFCALRVSFDHRTPPEDCAALAAAIEEVCARDAVRRRGR